MQSAFYLGYFLLAMPAALLIRRAGVQGGICYRACAIRSGDFLFWPAAELAVLYSFFLRCL